MPPFKTTSPVRTIGFIPASSENRTYRLQPHEYCRHYIRVPDCGVSESPKSFKEYGSLRLHMSQRRLLPSTRLAVFFERPLPTSCTPLSHCCLQLDTGAKPMDVYRPSTRPVSICHLWMICSQNGLGYNRRSSTPPMLQTVMLSCPP
jgi:hypothetical protein